MTEETEDSAHHLSGRYEPIEFLGSGLSGDVFRGVDHLLGGRPVALKRLRREHLADRQHLERFEREASIIGRIQHPNVIQIHDKFRSPEGDYYLVLELAAGGNLSARLTGTPMDWPDCVRIARQLCHGLAEAHDLGVVHRDVKPANVLFDARDNVKVSDFGIARLGTSTLSNIGSPLGTPAYASPEQVRGDPDVGPQSDIYGVGVVLFEMACGRRPFIAGPDQTSRDVAWMRLDGPPPDPAGLCPALPQAAGEIIRRAMSVDPADRQPSAADLAADLDESLESPPVLAPRHDTTATYAGGVTLPRDDADDGTLMEADAPGGEQQHHIDVNLPDDGPHEAAGGDAEPRDTVGISSYRWTGRRPSGGGDTHRGGPGRRGLIVLGAAALAAVAGGLALGERGNPADRASAQPAAAITAGKVTVTVPGDWSTDGPAPPQVRAFGFQAHRSAASIGEAVTQITVGTTAASGTELLAAGAMADMRGTPRPRRVRLGRSIQALEYAPVALRSQPDRTFAIYTAPAISGTITILCSGAERSATRLCGRLARTATTTLDTIALAPRTAYGRRLAAAIDRYRRSVDPLSVRLGSGASRAQQVQAATAYAAALGTLERRLRAASPGPQERPVNQRLIETTARAKTVYTALAAAGRSEDAAGWSSASGRATAATDELRSRVADLRTLGYTVH